MTRGSIVVGWLCWEDEGPELVVAGGKSKLPDYRDISTARFPRWPRMGLRVTMAAADKGVFMKDF